MKLPLHYKRCSSRVVVEMFLHGQRGFSVAPSRGGSYVGQRLLGAQGVTFFTALSSTARLFGFVSGGQAGES